MKNCIYKITSSINNKFYIGSAKDSIKRKSLHFRCLKNNCHHNIKLQNHVNKYGVDVLKFEILEFDCKQLILREQYYIDTLKPFFNICKIAGSRFGTTQSTITKNKISLSLIGKKHTIERRKNMSIGAKGVKRKPFTDEHKKNMSLGNKGVKRRPQKKEQIEKSRERLLGNTYARGKQYRNTPIIQLKNGILIQEYISIKEASIKLNTTQSNICHCLRGRTKKHKGYEWEYKKTDIKS